MPAETINCPICQKPMEKQDVPQGVEIDFCDEHGVWLDAGEFEVIAKADEQRAQSGAAPSTGKSAAAGVAGGIAAAVASGGVRTLIRSFFGRRW